MASAAEKAIEVNRDADRMHLVTAVADALEDGIDAAKRVGKKTSDATEELMDDTVNRVKRHPVESVVTAFTLGFMIGGFVDWVLMRRKSVPF